MQQNAKNVKLCTQMQNAENACECVREKMTHIPGKNDTLFPFGPEGSDAASLGRLTLLAATVPRLDHRVPGGASERK